MRINRLDLKAYGHFTDRVIDFRSVTPGLHIIYGPNEAGKSTALRALQGLLYGIPPRTADNFLHDYNKLMIGGHLQNVDGKELVFWRRKRNVGDLLDAGHNAIEPAVLADFLHSIEEPLFTALFGIDHETLVSGGRDILEQKGDVGRALFSAGAGLLSLHGLIDAMDKECEGLFKTGGSRPELNQAIKAYQDIKKQIRNLALSSTQWKEQQEIFDTASSKLEEIDVRKRDLGVELEGLKRLQRAIPYLVKRVKLQEQLAQLGRCDYLPVDFSVRLQKARETQLQIEKSLQNSRSRQSELEENKTRASFRQDILDQAETIDVFHQGLGVQRQAATDRPNINNQLIECRTRAETVLNQIAPTLSLTQADQIKKLLGRRKIILPLGNRFAGLERALTQAKARVGNLNKELNRLQTQLDASPEVGDVRGLNAAVATAQRTGDVDGLIRALDRDAGELMVSAAADLQQIGLWTGSQEDLLSMALPSAATIDLFVEQYREADDCQRRNRQDQQDTQQELDQIRRDIEAIKKAGAVATEADLSKARTRRDQGWQLIKRVWLGGETLIQEIGSYDEHQDLPGAFERGMYSADEVSDQLRSAADRVHHFAGLLSEAEKLEFRQQRLLAEDAQLAGQKGQLDEEWQAVWADALLQPRSPREMRSWIDQCHDVRRKLREGKQKESEKLPLIEQRKQRLSALVTELKNVGHDKSFTTEELSSVLTYAEQILIERKEIEDQRRKVMSDRERNHKDLLDATEELNASTQAMTVWSQEWDTALDGFGLPVDASVEDAANALEGLRICLDANAKIEGYQQRLTDMDQHAHQFVESVSSLITSVAPELGDLPADQAVVKLQAMVKEAEKAKSVLEKVDEDLERTLEETRQGIVDLQALEHEFTALRKQACCGTDEELLQVDVRFREYQVAQGELKNLEGTLFGIAEGIDLDVLEEQRQQVDPNELPGRIADLSQQIQEKLEPQIKIWSEKRGVAYSELQKMDGSGEAAAMEDVAQAALARVRRLADRYLRVRLGNQLLKREIERYRKENQDPILKTASRYFSELTLGAFPGLRADLDDNGNPILVGVCPDGMTRRVEGMSSGTRDQLYLALRLATLEWRLEKHEPMPFIADDILVNFDDVRSEATLKALAELAKKNQVILFTHHRQIVEAVENLAMDEHVRVHSLLN